MHRVQLLHSEKASSWEQLYKRAQKMRMYAIIQLVCVCITMIAVFLYIGWLIELHVSLPILLVAAGIGATGAVLIDFVYKRDKAPPMYRLPVRAGTPADYASICNAYEVEPDAYCGQQRFRNMDLRISILVQQKYNRDELQRLNKRVNKTFNQQHRVQNELPMEEAARRQRMKIVVLENSDPQLEKWVCNHSDTLMRRVEGIINIGILADQELLLFPAITELNIHSLKKYIRCAEFVKQYLLKDDLTQQWSVPNEPAMRSGDTTA